MSAELLLQMAGRAASGGVSLGTGQVILNVFLIIQSVIIVALRLYVRFFIVKTPGIDDLMAVVALAFCITMSALEILIVQFGSGQHIYTIPPQVLQRYFSLFPVNLLFLFWAACVVRLAVVAFLPRLSSDKFYVRLIYATGIVNVAVTTICFFLTLTSCDPISDLWDSSKLVRNCAPQERENRIVITFAAFGLAIDIALMLLPIWKVVTTLRFSRAKAIQVSLVFCVGLVSIVAGIVRLFIIFDADISQDITFNLVHLAAWADVEIHLGLWVACFPAIKPLLRLASFRFGFRDSPKSTIHATSGGGGSSAPKIRVPSRAGGANEQFHASMPNKGAGSTMELGGSYNKNNERNYRGRFSNSNSYFEDGGDDEGAYYLRELETPPRVAARYSSR